ncbi:predicted protein [Postia placenta Mad-698-R]|nr:predicted protein [Postia placenta Mad-698-R]
MVLSFPAELWLDIFHGLAKQGEYDTLERCRVVCKGLQPMAQECLLESMTFESTEDVERIKVDTSGEEMRRWGGPATVIIKGSPGGDQPIPHLATDLDADTVSHDLARFPSITQLTLFNVKFPTILTLGQLVCALPRLDDLILGDVRFTRQPFDASTISQFRLLPRTQLKRLYLGESEDVAVPTPSYVELVDVTAAIGNRQCLVAPRGPTQTCPVWSAIRALNLRTYGFPSVAALARLLCALPSLETLELDWSRTSLKHGFDHRSIPAHSSLPSRLEAVELTFGPPPYLDFRLMKHAMRSLHHLSVDADMLRLTLNGKYMSLHADKSAVTISVNSIYLQDKEWVLDALSVCLPKLAKRGILYSLMRLVQEELASGL